MTAHAKKDIVSQPRWSDKATCRYEGPTLFFGPDLPDGKKELKYARLRREKLAKAICAECIVGEDCLDAALANGEEYGIWGGLNEKELKERRGKAAS